MELELFFVLVFMGILFYVAYIYFKVLFQIKKNELIIRFGKERTSIPIDSITEINETDFYEGTKEIVVIGDTERTNYRFVILTKDKRYVLTERMNGRFLEQLKEINPSIKIFVR